MRLVSVAFRSGAAYYENKSVPFFPRSPFSHHLNAIEKLNCIYCGYGNQLIEYAREVAGRTEQFWCPIKHARRTQDPHHRTGGFVDYGDAAGYSARLEALRKAWDVDSTEG